MGKNKKESSAAGRIWLYLLVIVGIAAMGYSGYRVYGIYAEYAKGEEVYTSIRSKVASAEQRAQSAAKKENPESGAEGAEAGTAEAEVGGTKASGGEAKAGSAIDFEALRQINEDTVAWITLEGSVIDYPVVQGTDNDYYLNHLYTGEYGSAGSIFMDAANKSDFSDKNTLIFGHHMKNGSMFASLNKFKEQTYYQEHPSMTLYTPEGDHKVEWFSGYVMKAAPIAINFAGEKDFLEFVETARQNSDFESSVEVLPTDKLVTLVTCSYVIDDARYILLGVLRES